MTLASLLLAFAPALAARFKPVDETPREADESPADLKSHPRFIAGYDAGLKDGRREIDAVLDELERVRRQRDAAMDAISMRAANAPLQQRAMVNPLAQAQDGRYLAQQNLALQQQMMAQAQNAQLYAQYQGLLGNQGLLAPGFAQDPAMWPSCTPSRGRAGFLTVVGDQSRGPLGID